MRDNIKGYPGYHITKRGKVYSRWESGGHRFTSQWHGVKLRTYQGRVYVNLSRKKQKISRLVALAYIPNPNNYPNICHKDNNPLNNHVSNLYWGTQKMNMQQKVRDGRHVSNGDKIRGPLNYMYKLTLRIKRRCLMMISKGYKTKYIMGRLNISKGSISRIKHTKN